MVSGFDEEQMFHQPIALTASRIAGWENSGDDPRPFVEAFCWISDQT